MAFYLPQTILTILVLSLLLIILLFKICGKKALLYLLSLGSAVLVIAYFILPFISKGYNPILITLIASIPIIILISYCSEGFTLLANISIVVSIISFAITALLTYTAVSFAHFSGIISDTASIVGGEQGIDLQQLLSAGIMLSSLGAIIEMVITQVATVLRLVSSNHLAGAKEIYKQSNDVGVAHLGAIISTLFLIYAGVSLPLLIIFSDNTSFANLFSYEPFSSEVVRMLTGMIGLVIAMPLSTSLAIWWLKRKE